VVEDLDVATCMAASDSDSWDDSDYGYAVLAIEDINKALRLLGVDRELTYFTEAEGFTASNIEDIEAAPCDISFESNGDRGTLNIKIHIERKTKKRKAKTICDSIVEKTDIRCTNPAEKGSKQCGVHGGGK